MMPSRVPEMINLFSKFRIMGANELSLLVGPSMSRRHANRYIRKLIDLGLIVRRTHPRYPVIVFEVTNKLLEHALSEKAGVFRDQRDQDLLHRIKCTEALINLCKRENVSGVAIEHELSSEEIRDFNPERTPDGIIQLSRPDRTNSYEIALEVELRHKGIEQIEDLIHRYERVFKAGTSYCTGALLVVPDLYAHAMFLKHLEKRDPTFRDRFLVTNKTDLSDLDEKVFGRRLESAYFNRYNSCLSKRLTRQNIVNYLIDPGGRPRLRAHRGVSSCQTERLENS